MNPKPRSNKPVTQFACREFVKCHRRVSGELYESRLESTSIKCQTEDPVKSIKAYLFDREILSVILVNSEAVSIRLNFDGNISADGRPSGLLVERLNGLLDQLGIVGMLPMGVRLFRNRDTGDFYLGKGDDCILIGRDYAKSVLITPSAVKLLIQDINIEVMCPLLEYA